MKSTLFALLFTTFHIAFTQSTTTVFQPNANNGKDALLHGLSSEVNTNYGSNPQLAATSWTFGGTPGTVRAIIDFDLSSIPPNSTISSASLSFYAYDSNNGFGQHSVLSGSNSSHIQRITSPWTENTVTWANQPSTTTANQITISASTAPTDNYLNINTTNLVQDMVNNPSSSHGFLLKLVTENAYRRINFASSDHANAELRPKLIVTYASASIPIDTCLTFQPGSELGEDAFVHGLSSQVNNNFGNNRQLSANAWTFGGANGVVRSLLKFDLSAIPSNAQITSSTLSLHSNNSDLGFGFHSTLSGPNGSVLQRVTSDWEEQTVTWNSQPSATSTNQVLIPATTDPIQDFLNINTTQIVQDMIAPANSNYGFLLKLQNENQYRMVNFASSDHYNSLRHPELEVCYTATTPLITANGENKELFSIFNSPLYNDNELKINILDKTTTNISIFDSRGRLVGTLTDFQDSINYPISNFAPGMYIIKASNSTQSTSKKFVVL